jgi:carbon-monoxide dehydrogenase small subunit
VSEHRIELMVNGRRHAATVEALAEERAGELHALQQVFHEAHGLQCGFCTPGVAITLAALTADGARPGVEELEAAMSGHVCRCTGYQGIRRAIRALTGETTPATGDHA